MPLALGFLVVTRGDFEQSIFGGANYGRDCDSIASMAGAIAGTLHGAQAIRPGWIDQIKRANRIDLDELGNGLTLLARKLQQRELAEVQARNNLLAQLSA